MKVLFVYKYLTLGGCETVLRARLDALPSHGIGAHAWFLYDLGGRTIFRGVEDRVRVGDRAALRNHLERSSYDLVAAIDSPEVLSLVPAISRLVVEVHTAYAENTEYLRGVNAEAVAGFFVPSHHQATVVRRRVRGAAHVYVAPNPVRDIFLREIVHPPASSVRPIVAWIGRLDALKDWREFLRVCEAARGSETDAAFWIIGKATSPDGPAELLAGARKAGLLGRIRWFSHLPHERMPSLLDCVRDSGGAVLSTSRGESFGMTIAEGMARGCAVVAPAASAFPEFVEDGRTGLLYEPGSTKAACRALLSVLGDASRRRLLGAQAREVVRARFSPEVSVRVLAEHLETLAARIGGASRAAG